MRLLYLIPYVPNLIRVRPYNLIRSIKQKGHEVTLLTLIGEKSELEDIEFLRNEGIRVHYFQLPRWRSLVNSLAALPGQEPLQSRFCWQPKLAHLLEIMVLLPGQTNGFDLIHIEHLRGVRYGIWLKDQARQIGGQLPPFVWDSVDCISHLFSQAFEKSGRLKTRLMAQLDLSRTRKLEEAMVGYFEKMLVTSQVDKGAFVSLSPRASANGSNIAVIANGVDIEYFTAGDLERREPATLLVSGKMSYHANIAMVTKLITEIMPLIWKEKPEVKVWIVGKDPPNSLVKIGEDQRVVISGTVPDIRPYLKKATVAVAPISYGAGIQNKILEAMACGTPVVTSPQAISALSVINDQDLLVADNIETFARKTLQLLSNPEKRHQMGEAGKRYVQANHNWKAIINKLEIIYNQVTNP